MRRMEGGADSQMGGVDKKDERQQPELRWRAMEEAGTIIPGMRLRATGPLSTPAKGPDEGRHPRGIPSSLRGRGTRAFP